MLLTQARREVLDAQLDHVAVAKALQQISAQSFERHAARKIHPAGLSVVGRSVCRLKHYRPSLGRAGSNARRDDWRGRLDEHRDGDTHGSRGGVTAASGTGGALAEPENRHRGRHPLWQEQLIFRDTVLRSLQARMSPIGTASRAWSGKWMPNGWSSWETSCMHRSMRTARTRLTSPPGRIRCSPLRLKSSSAS